MTLYTALMNDRTDYGWMIATPNGSTECYDVSGHAIMEILEENPELMTATVSDMTFEPSVMWDNDGVIKVTLTYGTAYRGNMKYVLTGYEDTAPDIGDAITLLGYQGKEPKDITLAEISKIAGVCKCTTSEVLAYMGF